MNYTEILFEEKGAIAKITLNRPDSLNACNWDLMDQLRDAIEKVAADDKIKVAIITGAGRAFCAGGDLKFFKAFLNDNIKLEAWIRHFHRTVNTIELCPKPVIAAVQGLALAGGLEIVLGCDIVVAAEDARLGDQHANFGLVPGGGATQRLPRIVGIRKAKELIFTGDWLSAGDAEKLGLVNKVVAADKLEETVMELANKLAAKSPIATARSKALINRGMETDFCAGLELEIQVVTQHLGGYDAAEGIRAFEAKDMPVFKGK